MKQRWDEIKAEEKAKASPKGLLDGVPRSLPALVEAQQIASTRGGRGIRLGKRRAGVRKAGRRSCDELRERGNAREIEDEIGDLLFVIVNIARFMKVDPEQALRKTNAKFRRRFAHVEAGLAAQGKTPREATIDEMEALWQDAKQETERMIEIRALHDTSTSSPKPSSCSSIIWGFEDVELLPVRLFVTATEGRRPGVRRVRRRPDDRILPGDSRDQAAATGSICTATCSAC